MKAYKGTLFLFVFLALFSTMSVADTILIPTGSQWKYLDNGSDQGTAWTSASFSDTAWKSGSAQLGYGDGDETTVVSYGSSSSAKHITTYFRKTFEVFNPSLYSAIVIRLIRDDGAVVYINGAEVIRTNMPTGTITYTTRAPGSASPENAFHTFNLPNTLVAGTNVIAVELHQDTPSSSDISFEVELSADASSDPSGPPADPASLSATALSSSEVDLFWTDASNNESSFEVERSMDSVNFSKIAEAAANSNQYRDNTGQPSTQYYYRIRSFNTNGFSGYSNVGSATTFSPSGTPVAPGSVAATSQLGHTPFEHAWFYKPPLDGNLDLLADRFDRYIFTKRDEASRDTLESIGANEPIIQYLLANEIQDPGSCTAQPHRNQVADRIGDFCAISAQHPDWFLTDANGVRLSKVEGSQTIYYMDPGNAGWRAFFIQRAKESQDDLGWDGVFLDNVDGTLRRLARTGRLPAVYPTDTSYQAAVESYLNDLYNSYFKPSNKQLQGNITETLDPQVWFRYLGYLDGAMLENFAVNWDPGYHSVSVWEEHLSRAEQSLQLGERLILVGQGQQADSTRQQFAYGSYLLVAGPGASFRYTMSDFHRDAWLYPNYDIDLGKALGPRYQSNGLWRRDFARGYVIVDPTNRTAQIVGTPENKVLVTWEDLSNNESEFRVERSTNGTNFSTIGTVGANQTRFIDTQIVTSGTYFYKVLAVNATGASVNNDVASVNMLAGPPSAASPLIASSSTGGINLVWVDTSGNENGFYVERSLNGLAFTQIASLSANATSFSDSNVAPFTTYYYRVLAYNGEGNSTYSNISGARTSASILEIPGDLNAAAISENRIDLAWIDTCLTEDGFAIERSTDGVNFVEITTVAQNTVTYSNTNLSGGTQYYYRIRAYNENGYSAYSNIANATTQMLLPAAPSSLAASAASSSQINLSWNDNSTNESGFRIERSTDGVNFTQIATTSAGVTTFSNTGLTQGLTYYYRVCAYNSAGNSSYSNTANATTPVPVPAAPSSLAASAASSSQINLSWNDNSTNESGFRIERSTDGVNFHEIGTTASNTTSYSNTGLSPSTKYYYQVRAFSSGGSSAASNQANATTQSVPSVPAAPVNLTATAINRNSISLNWQDQSSNEDGFKIERSTDGTQFQQIGTVGANVTSYLSSGLKRNKKYYYRVRAFNQYGNSPYSNTSTSTTPSSRETGD